MRRAEPGGTVAVLGLEPHSRGALQCALMTDIEGYLTEDHENHDHALGPLSIQIL